MCSLNRRSVLGMKASILRFLMSIGMALHHSAYPKPPKPSFTLRIPSMISKCPGEFKLVFYVPDNYWTAPENHRFPVVINYHGGGFTVGSATDDSRWAAVVIQDTKAVYVSVGYRLAPKHPFCTGVEDSADAVLYLASHADELRIDPHRMALSGFSAGGNFVLTVPLLLHDLKVEAEAQKQRELARPLTLSRESSNSTLPKLDTNRLAPSIRRPALSRSSSAADLPRYDNDRLRPLARPITLSRKSSAMSLSGLDHELLRSSSAIKLLSLEPTALELHQEIPEYTITSLVAFYPPTDFRISREEKKAKNPMPALNLPNIFTDLFDESYLFPKEQISMCDPYLSPCCASDENLAAAYPKQVIIYTCEYDMLNDEGIEFAERLRSPPLNLDVKGGLIVGAPHGFDKKPNPVKFSEDAARCYGEACAELNAKWGRRTTFDSRRQLSISKKVERFDENLDRHIDRHSHNPSESTASSPTMSRKRASTGNQHRHTDITFKLSRDDSEEEQLAPQ